MAEATESVRVLTPADYEQALEILDRAFGDDPLTTYLLLGARDVARARRLQFALALRLHFPGGYVVGIGVPLQGVATILPGRARISVLGFFAWYLGFLGYAFIVGLGGIARGVRLHREFKSRRPGAPHAYVAAVAVHPEQQGQGVGRRLMPGVAAHVKGRGGGFLYLETSNVENLPFYEKCGFKTREQWDADSGRGPRTWSMARET